MKTLLLSVIMLFAVPVFAQKPMGEKEAINSDVIDFKKQYLYFTIHGLIEIDGHTFNNDTCKSPVQYKADLNGVYILFSGKEYEHSPCNKKDCKVIHLEENRTFRIENTQPNLYGDYLIKPCNR